MADVFSRWALQTCVKYLPRVAKNPDDREARRQMLLAIFFFIFPLKNILTSLWVVWLLHSPASDLEMPVFTCVTGSVIL